MSQPMKGVDLGIEKLYRRNFPQYPRIYLFIVSTLNYYIIQ